MLKKFSKYINQAQISVPVASLIFLRILIKVLLLLSAIYFRVSLASLFIIIFIFLITEIYRNVGTILSSLKKFPDEAIGSIVSAIDGAIIVLLLYYTNLLGTDLYLFIILSITFDTIEYGINAAMAEGLTAGISFAFIESFLSQNYADTITKVLIIIFIGIITGWLSEKVNKSEKILHNTILKDKKARKLNKLKNAFINISAHKVKTPISVIEGYIELLLNERVGKLNENQKDYVLKINDNARKLDMLLSDLLSVLTLQNNQITIAPSENYPYKLIEEMKYEFSATEKLKGIKYLVDIDINNKELGSFDDEKIKIALSNLLSYSFDKARTTVSLNSYINNRTWFIEIKDDSVGINKTEIKRILEKEKEIFDTIRDLEDRGLNLYITHLIIEAHKGGFEIISIEGIGTTFKINLPL